MESRHTGRETLFRLLRMQTTGRGVTLPITLLLASSILLNLARPWPLAVITNELARSSSGSPVSTRFIFLWVVAGLGLHWLHSALQSLTNKSVISVGVAAHAALRQRLFDHMVKLPMRAIQSIRTGDLIQRVIWDSACAHTAFQQILFQAAQSTLTLILMALVLASVHTSLAITAFLAVPLLLIVLRMLGPVMNARGNKAQQAEGRAVSQVHESLQALPLLKLENRIEAESKEFGRVSGETALLRIQQHQAELSYSAGIAATLALGMALVTFHGSLAVRNGQLSIGALLVFLAYLGQFYEPVQQLSYAGATIADVLGRARRVFEILDLPCETDVATGSGERDLPAPLSDRPFLELRNVCYSHLEGLPVIREVCIKLEHGERLVITGSSGAGKSTLLMLLARLEDPDSGTILYNGTDLKHLNREAYRGKLGVIFQDPPIFSGTVAENIALGTPGASKQAIEAAARMAGADLFIQGLRNGYETRLGEGETRLSVGEKQRLNLARVFLKKPDLILLDEPTSALDEVNEINVVQALDEFLENRTAVIITHKPLPIKLGTRFVKMENGRII